MEKIYDVLILGGGVAGMSAGVYAKRRNKQVAIIEKFSLGGQVNTIPVIENFPSAEKMDGISLTQQFVRQIESFDVEVIYDDIYKVDYSKAIKVLVGKVDTYRAKSVIIATGLSYIELGKNEKDFLGKGVSYCSVCDAHFFKNEPVCVASKGGSGLKDAVFLTEVCSHVTVLDTEDISIYAKANKNPKLEVLSQVKIGKLIGEEVLTGVTIFDKDKTKQTIPANALFVAFGKKPNKSVFGGVAVDKNGFILTDENMKTSIKGVFAVGDVRSKALKQVVTACSDGAIAGQFA